MESDMSDTNNILVQIQPQTSDVTDILSFLNEEDRRSVTSSADAQNIQSILLDSTALFSSIALSPENEIITTPTRGVYIDSDEGQDTIVVDAAQGIDIAEISRWSDLGRELGVDSDTSAVAFYDHGATAVIDGREVSANHQSIQNNQASRDSDAPLSDTALETTTQLAGVAKNIEAIVATEFDDRYLGYSSDIDVYTGDGNDYIRSLGGNKTLDGGNGNDDFYVRGGQGAFIKGGDGFDQVNFSGERQGLIIESVGRYGELGDELDLSRDTASYSVRERGKEVEFDGESVAANYVTVNNNGGPNGPLSESALETALAFGHVTVNVEEITASKLNDVIFGGRYAERFLAHDGNDFIDSRAGDDYIDAGAGDDQIILTSGNNTILGNEGTDTLWLRGDVAKYQISQNEDGSFTIVSGEFVNTVSGVENARLSDGTILSLQELVNAAPPADDPIEDPVDDPIEDPIDDLPDPNEDPIEDPVDEPVDDPVVSIQAQADSARLSEDASVTLNLLANDEGENLTISSVSQPANGSVTINQDGTVTYTAASDYSGEDSFTYTASDANGNESTATVSLNILSVNDQPVVVVPNNIQVSEAVAVGVAVATIAASDIDNDALAYSIVSGNDDGIFAINELTGEITIANNQAIDFETASSHSLQIAVSDGQAITTAVATIDVTNVNEAPVVAAIQTSIVESIAAGSVLAQVNAIDPDGDALTYAITSGNEQQLFEIDAQTGEIKLAENAQLDFESQAFHDIEISVSDGDTTQSTSVQLSVLDVDEGLPSANELLAQTDRAFGEDNGTVTVGLNGASDFNSQLLFLNLANNARPVNAHGQGQFGLYHHDDLREQGYLDEQGYPTELPDDASTFGIIWAETVGREGTYVLRWEGEGNLDIRYDAEVISRSDNEIVFKHNSGSFEVYFSETDPNGTGDNIRNISVVKEEYVDIYDAGAIFNPEALDRLQDFREFRNLALSRTIESPIETLDDVVPVGYQTYGTTLGTPVEILVELANQTGTDLWFTVPTQANDEVLDYYATYIRDNLDPKLQVTFEYGNELWNNGYRDTHQLRAESQEVWDGVGPEDYIAHTHYVTKKATEAALRFDAVFEQVPEDERPLLHKALGTQPAVPIVTERLLDPFTWQEQEPDSFVHPAEVFDSIAVTTYFGGATISRENLRNDLIDAINDPNVDAQLFLKENLLDPDYPLSLPATRVFLEEQREIADRYGLGVTDYEGGAHLLHFDNTDLPRELVAQLQDFYVDFYRSEHMADLYQEIWDIWRDVGTGPFSNLGSVGEPSVYGFFSFLSDLNDTSPRAEFLYEQNANIEPWWEDRGGEHFQQGLIETGTSDDDLFIGTNQEDQFSGGAGDDFFVSGYGNDVIHGGDGTDRILLAGTRDDYDVYRDEEGRVIFRSENSTDSTLSIELVEFQDGTVFNISDLIKDLDAPNEGPVANDDVVQAVEDQRIIISNLLDNDTDADGDTLVIVGVEQAEHGRVLLNADGSVSYIPDPDFEGEDSFTYVVSDGIERREAVANVFVQNQIDAPDVTSERLAIFGEDYTAGDAVLQVTATDLDNDTLTFSIVAGNDDGRFAIDAATGLITVVTSLENDLSSAQEFYDITVAVDDGTFTSEAHITFDVQHNSNLISEGGVAGSILNGLDGDHDLLQLEAFNGRGRSVGAIGRFGDTYDELQNLLLVEGNTEYVYRINSSGYSVEVDGETFTANNDTYNQGLETGLLVSNVAVNFEGVSGTEFRDTFFGTRADDIFLGNGGNDYINGGRGNDTLNGGAGVDTLAGRQGADTFVFDTLGDGVDHIDDFSFDDGDKIDISDILEAYDPLTDAISDFVSISVNENDVTEIAVSAEGNGEFVTVADFRTDPGVVTLDELVNNDSLILD